MHADSNKVIRICFYALWLIVSFIQAYFTELLADEAYYWKYAQDLAWGYFDHPPMVGVFIKAGYSIIQNESGVRLLFILASTGMFYLLELLAQPKKLLSFYLILSSIGAFHFLGLFALPDMPLLLFSTAYLYLLRTYIEKDSIVVSLLLSVTITLMLLSKYHGVLFIAFTILAYPAIIKRWSFWLIAVGSIILFLPHVFWQFDHDLPSIKYHLSERSSEGYRIDFTLNYLLSTLLMFSPVVGIVLTWKAITLKQKRAPFEKVLYSILIGTLVFFFIMSFKGRTEGNWVAMAIAPAILIGYKIVENKPWFSNFLRKGFIATLVIIFTIRLFLVYDFLPDLPQLFLAKNKVHHTKEWARAIADKAEGKPVVFMNKYQYAAWYEYYTGGKAISLNNRMGRKNQYNIWVDEHEMQGKDIMVVPNYYVHDAPVINTTKGEFQYYFFDNFRSSSFIRIKTSESSYSADRNGEVEIEFSITQSDNHAWDITNNLNYMPVLHALLFQEGSFIENQRTEFSLNNMMLIDSNKDSYVVKYRAPAQAGNYTLYLDVSMGNMPPSINSNAIELIVR